MEKSEIRIFIVDDDMSMGKAVTEALKKEGYNPVHCLNPTDAFSQFKKQGAQAFIIDCLLPKMSGVDFVEKLRQEGASTAPIFLMSGVFKDRGFVKDSLQKTGALEFFTKPFNISDLVNAVNKSLSSFIDEELSPYEHFLSQVLTPGEKIKKINQISQVESFELPFFYCMLMNAGATGILKLEYPKFPMSVSFSNGKIIQVDMKNPDSFFGHLLIENGYLTPQQLEEALKLSSQKRIGERLVELNYLSPHAIDLINAEQIAIRLSMTISSESYQVSFNETPLTNTSAFIDQEMISPFLIDWLNSKFTLNWLKQKYLQYVERELQYGLPPLKWQRLTSCPIFKNNSNIVKEFESGHDLEEILEKYSTQEETVYQIFHLLVITEHLKLKTENKKSVDLTAYLVRLKKIYSDIQNQDYFAVLGVGRSAKSIDIKKTYHELAKIFHPDKLPAAATAELKEIAQKVFTVMTKAYEVLSNDSKRQSYSKELEMGRAEKILQAEALFEEGKTNLFAGQAGKALEKFKEAEALKPPSSDLLVHIAWALLSSCEQNKNSVQISEAESILNKTAPEDRHNATYYFVKGYYQRMTNDFVAARKNIMHALSLKPKFIEAERLLRFLDIQKAGKPVDILHGDIKDVVGSLFKK